MTYTVILLLSILDAKANPLATDSPCPREPDENLTKGNPFVTCVVSFAPNFPKFSSSLTSIRPNSANST